MKRFFLCSALMLTSLEISAKEESKPCYTKLSEVLNCFMKHDDGVFKYQLLSKTQENGLSIEKYIFDSQIWPVDFDADIPSTTWQHRLHVYIPDTLSKETNKILLFVGAGYNYNTEGKAETFDAKENLKYKDIALENQAIVVALYDVPNQYLAMNKTFKKEDQFLAYTYKKVMESPLKNGYLAGHLPMAKAIVKAMDAAQSIVSEHIQKPRFVLSGASKRAWAIWLANLEDTRVDAIAPVVLDVLNTQKSILHICEVYKSCPYALRDYEAEGLTDKIASKEFADLMKIEDPYSYLGSDYDPKYKIRMAVPKLLIQSSGDNFFVPDSSKFYFKDLPGTENYIRYLPNTMHYLGGNSISDRTRAMQTVNDAVNAYFSTRIHEISLPKLEWTYEETKIVLKTSLKPKKIRVWTAFNKDRDFRFLNSISWWHSGWKLFLSLFTKDLCDACYVPKDVDFSCKEFGECNVDITLPLSKEETYRASFVEVIHEVADREFITTSEVHVDILCPNPLSLR